VRFVGVSKIWLPVEGISVLGIKFKSATLTERFVVEKIEN